MAVFDIEQTGNGFIKVVSGGGGDGYDLKLQIGRENGGGREMMMLRTNPATNEWIPSTEDDDNQPMFVSAKPNRSESA